jgi:two-component system, chemotaxis family, CheB/CheR fusion protein
MKSAFVFCNLLKDDNGNVSNIAISDFNPSFERLISHQNTLEIDLLEYISTNEYTSDYWLKYFVEILNTNAKSTFEIFSDKLNKFLRLDIYKVDKDELAIIFNDISELKNLINDLEEANRKIENISDLRSNFIANMSHEIRTPMNGIIGFSSLLRSQNIDKDTMKKYVDIIINNSNSLLNLIDDIIDISKIDSGLVNLSQNEFKLFKVFDFLYTNFIQIKYQRGKSNIDLKLTVDPHIRDLIVVSDESKIKQIVSNLLLNAIKFSNSGTIELGYQLQNDFVEIFVKDQGIGIAEEKMNNIFNRFEKIDDLYNQNSDGVGLGLSIVQGIVSQMNGSIRVNSTIGEGSEFYIQLPIVHYSKILQKGQKKEVIDYELKRSLKLLIAEDDEINREYFKAILDDDNLDVTYVTNGEDAVKVYSENMNFDIVLMDIRMPVMDGIKAAELILAKDPSALIIAQTAHAMADDNANFKKQGFKDYIAKPIDRDDLFQKLDCFRMNIQ